MMKSYSDLRCENMYHEPIHIVFSGGGTGGHLFPGLAVAKRLAASVPNVRITFCGSGKAFEQHHVAQAGFGYLAMSSRPLPNGAREAVAFVVENLAGYLTARRFLRDEHVAAVVGLGGYASAPMAKAAARLHVPLVLLEQNVIPGRATRWLSRNATLLCTAFEATQEKIRNRCPIRVTGNPVRETIQPRNVYPSRSRRLVILGGSGGARSLNESVPPALYKVREGLQSWQIVHQTGEAGLNDAKTLYGKLGLNAHVVPFLPNMPKVLAETDFVICRAGGTTLAELAVANVPGVLLPYPRATDDHQLVNAQHFAEGGGCVALDERTSPEPLDDRLASVLGPLLFDEALRNRMSEAMRELARPNAASDVAELIWSIVSSRSRCAELAVA
jgi:UDP-N-acetylglucosamine--N-acetylmuramyl-(pentapeptide) pyrophosphoryl-undecaprenol N-acetylglucosamine transferase